MGSSTTVQNQTSTPQPTANDTALQNNELQLSNAALPYQLQNQTQAFGLQNNLMSGNALPGYLGAEPAGANVYTNGSVPQANAYGTNPYAGQVSQVQAQNEAQLGLQGLATQFQGQGGLDTGAYAQAGANAYANVLNQNAQFNASNDLQNQQYNSSVLNQNSQFNAGNMLQNQQFNTSNLNLNSQFNVQNLAQLLNLASGNAYQNVGLSSANNQMLGQQATALAGNQTTGRTTDYANPFSQAIGGLGAIGQAGIGIAGGILHI